MMWFTWTMILATFGALLTPVEDELELLGGPQAGVDTDLDAVVHQGAERLVHHDAFTLVTAVRRQFLAHHVHRRADRSPPRAVRSCFHLWCRTPLSGTHRTSARRAVRKGITNCQARRHDPPGPRQVKRG